MFKARVFSLGVLTDDTKVNIFVACLVARNVFDQNNRRKNIKLLPQSNIERLVARALNGGEEDTLETQLVAAERSDGFLKELLRVLVTCIHTTDIYLLPLNGYIVGLEDSLDRFGDFSPNSVTWNKRNSVLSAILGRLEDVRLNTSKRSC